MRSHEMIAHLRPEAARIVTALFSEDGIDDADTEARAIAAITELVENESRARVLAGEPSLDPDERTEVASELFNVLFRFGPLQTYLEDPDVEELVLNAPDTGFVLYAGGEKLRIDPGFRSEEEVRSILGRAVGRAGRRIDESSPAVDVRLPDGSRLHAVVPPLCHSTAITIRRHRMVASDLDDLVRLGTLPREAASFLDQGVRAGLNILVSGGTASGKTTTLNALGQAIPPNDRVVTIEETAELRLEQALSDCVALESRAANIEGAGEVSIRELVRQALRMRPTRVIVGEVRGAEALDMLSAMNTGHDGSMGTIHANSARQALGKLRTYVLMAEEQLSAEVATEMIADTIDLVVHLRLDQRAGVRRVTQIAEVAGLEAGRVLSNDIFCLLDGTLERTGFRPRCAERMAERATVVSMLADRSQGAPL